MEKAKEDRTGNAMEEFATYLFSCINGFEPVPRKQTKAFHFDIVVRNLVVGHPLLTMLGEYIGAEAKNIKKTASVEQLNHFINKLRLHGMRCGIIFTNRGISGMSFGEDSMYGKAIQVRTFNRANLVVFDLTLKDIGRLTRGDNLITLLLKKYEEIRYQ